MPKAIEVATELRRIADALEAKPETIVHKPWLHFYCDEKKPFLDTFSVLPRPLIKRYDRDNDMWDRVHLESNCDALDLDCSVPRSKICEIVEPAKPAVYNCPPLLSEEEESTLTSA